MQNFVTINPFWKNITEHSYHESCPAQQIKRLARLLSLIVDRLLGLTGGAKDKEMER